MPPATALHQLPSPPRDFTGRKEELDELMRALEQGGVTISASLQGLGGVGKTTLALKLAQQFTARYPDAQFYLDLKGTSKTPLSASNAMAHVIRAYQPTTRLPEGEAELSALYRSVLHNQRALLLMDNAAERKQVEPLIPPESCVMLVTSRQHFTLPGLFTRNLDALPAEDANKLLLKIAPRIGEQADTLAKLCGYLPLALRLAASALAELVDLGVADYVRRLTDTQQRLKVLDEVEASLSLSYELLSPEMQERWRVLAVFPDTFDAAAAAAIWEIDADAAQDALSELVKYSLLEWNKATVRYRLHDLARLFANTRLSEAEQDEGQRRHASRYLRVSREANSLYEQGGDALKRGLVLFDLEWTNIQSGQAWAVKNAMKDKYALELCDDYSTWSYFILPLRQHPSQYISWLETALRAAKELGRKQAEAWHLGNLAGAYFESGETRRAIEFQEQVLAIAREIGDRRSEVAVLGNLGMAHGDLGETRRAIEFYEQALIIGREIDDLRAEGHLLVGLGDVYRRMGEPRRAIEFYEQALVIIHEIGDRLNEGAVMSGLGIAYKDLGETRRAIEFYEQHLIIAREIGDRTGEGKGLWNMSLALDKLGERDEAISYAEAALKIKEQIESPSVAKVREQLAEWRGQGK